MNLVKLGIKGLKWTTFSRFLRQILQFVTIVILANILSPSEFGLMSMAMVVIGFLNIFRDMGMASALIHIDDYSRVLFSSLFWINFIFSLVIATIIFLLTPLIADFYTEPRIESILKVLSIGFILHSLSALQQARLEKDLKFKSITIFETISTLIASILGISAALLGYGVWSLVAQNISYYFVLALVLWTIKGERPYFRISFSQVKQVFNYSINLSGFSFINYFMRNADYLLIGKFLGATELGYYSLAYRIILYPLQNISNVISRVMFPLYSKIKNDNQNFRNYYTKAAKVIGFITLPLLFGLMSTANLFVFIFLDAKWEPIIPILIILAPVGLLQTITATTGSIYQAKGRTDLMFKWGLLSSIIILLGFFIGLNWGISGVAIGYLLANLLLFYHWLKIPLKLINLAPLNFLNSLKQEFLIAIIMGLTVGFLNILFSDVNQIVVFVGLVAFAALLYLWAIVKFDKPFFSKLKNNFF